MKKGSGLVIGIVIALVAILVVVGIIGFTMMSGDSKKITSNNNNINSSVNIGGSSSDWCPKYSGAKSGPATLSSEGIVDYRGGKYCKTITEMNGKIIDTVYYANEERTTFERISEDPYGNTKVEQYWENGVMIEAYENGIKIFPEE